VQALSSADIFLFEGFRLDRRGLFRRDEIAAAAPVEIGSRALDVLCALLQRPGDLISRDEIMAAAWPGVVVEDNNLTIQIASLRRVLDRDSAQGSCIQTVPGRGYRFVSPVKRVEPASSPASALSPGNGSGGSIAGNGQSLDPVAPSPKQGLRRPPMFRALRRFRGGVVAAIGALVLVVAVAAANWHLFWRGSSHAAPRLSIVVLPFANIGNDPEQQYFADGITEDVTTDLSRIADMFVISRSTAFTYKDKRVDAKQIGRELEVRYVLEGSVRRSGDQIRVNAQLIDVATDAYLWAERFDRDIGDLFALQNEVTGRIAVALNIELIAAEAARPTNNPSALDYIFRGRAAGLKPASRDTYGEMISMFERALALDPRSPAALSRLANVLAGRALNGLTDSEAADIARAEGLVAQALAASPRYAPAHAAKGLVLTAESRCQEAIPEFEIALAIDRNVADVLNTLAACKLLTGAIEEVIPLEEQAIRLSPRDPRIGNFYNRVGFVNLMLSRPDEAILWLEKARSAVPELPWTRCLLAAAYGVKGETERASVELAEARKLQGGDRWSSITKMKAFAGGWGAMSPKMRALSETTYYAGLRKAGMPEE
jgi:TolB-like protein/DNA-binding winged helix-turn-helix (wHTH) protein/Flp pilus assembly protein TadD